jgi:hypothetical protein
VSRKLLLTCLLAAGAVAAVPATPAAAACNENANPMSVCDARSFVKYVARYRSGHNVRFTILRCKRLSPRSFRCGVRFVSGDLIWRGAARVGFRNSERFDDYYFFRLKRRRANTDAVAYLRWRCPRLGTCG